MYLKQFLSVGLIGLATLTSTVSAQVTPNQIAPRVLSGHMAAAWKNLAPKGRLAATNELRLAIGLPLRNQEALSAFLAELQDPASPNYHHYLTPAEFTSQYGPTEADYAAAIAFAAANGLRVTEQHPNRVVLDVAGAVADVEKAFHVTLQTYQHPREARDFFAPDTEPSVTTLAPIIQVSGLNNYSTRRPHSRREPNNLTARAISHAGTGPGATYSAKDILKAYLPGVTNLTGTGQSVGLLQFDAYYAADITKYIATNGITTSASLVKVAVDGGVSTPGSGNGEVSLDIEMVLALAPGVSKIYVYEAPNPSPWEDLLSRMANDNTAKQLSCSWGETDPGPPTNTVSEGLFNQMAAQGQSFFNASGDSDAFTNGIPFPSESTNITQVGATTLTTGAGAVYGSEQVWNWGVTLSATTYDGVGSSGGISLNFNLPTYQQGMSANLTSAGGSQTKRNVPDVAFLGDNVYSIGDNGTGGATAGTSCAAPLWAGLMALVNQQGAANGLASAGFINPAVYAIGKGVNYNSCFHDTVISSNTWSASPTKFKAVTGFDLCTGWGTPNGPNLINALAPIVAGPAKIVTSPASSTNSYGATVALTVVATGDVPRSYKWFFNNVPNGATNATLAFPSIVSSNAGNYYVIVTNSSGSDTSTVATLTVILTPSITQPPVSQSILIGQPAGLTVAAVGAPPLGYQWRKNGTNLLGEVATNYAIASVAAEDSGNYDVVVTNGSGSVTSSVAVLTAVNPAYYTGVLAGWDVSGQTGSGPSPLAPTTNAPNLTVTGLTRGSGLTTSGSAAARAWGATGWSQTTAAAGVTANQFATCDFTAAGGYAVSFSAVSILDYRRSGTGPANGVLQYQVGSGAFTDVTILSYPTSTSGGDSLSAIDLSGIPALQNVLAGTTVTFRLVNYAATGSGGTWYVYDRVTPGRDDFEITGSLSPLTVNTNPVAPIVTTGAATVIGTNTATVNGTVTPGNQNTTAQFLYGLTTNYTLSAAVAGVLTGTGAQAVSANLTGLTPSTTYHFAVTATNNSGSVTGADHTFTTTAGGSGGAVNYSGILAGWETTGLTNYGTSPFVATTNAPNVTVVGLARGSGVGLNTPNNAAANAWGGSGFVFADEPTAITGNSFAMFSLTAGAGNSVSFTNIPAYNIRHSGTGSTTGIWQYQVGAGTFTDIGSAITWGSVVSGTAGNPEIAIDLSGISALQNVAAGTTVTFRMVLWGGTGTGTWYVNNQTGYDLQVLGTLTALNVGPAISATNSLLTANPPVVRDDGTNAVTITVTERDINNNPLTNNGVAPVLSQSFGTLGPVTGQGNGVYTATLKSTNPGFSTVSGTISGIPIANGATVQVYFAEPQVGTNGLYSFVPGFSAGQYSLGLSGRPSQTFTVWSTTNLALPLAQWKQEADVSSAELTMFETTFQGSPSAYSFIVKPPTNVPTFYRVRTP